MLSKGIGRHRAAICLLIAGSVALVGAQQVLGSVAEAESPTLAVVDAHDLQRLPEPHSAASSMVSPAVSSGQFEDLVKPTPVPTVAPTAVPTVAPTPEPAQPRLYESGIASTYGEGDGFEGNLTACGQIFHTRVVQVAHKSLPCGTTLRIEDVSTGRTVEAVVTDRGPYIPGRIVDLSWGAFEELDPTGPGLLPVNIYIVED